MGWYSIIEREVFVSLRRMTLLILCSLQSASMSLLLSGLLVYSKFNAAGSGLSSNALHDL
jgi:hypothetical protein